jgi:hypothetical protein
MATPANNKYAKWKSHQEAILVATLTEQKQISNWGDNNPKKTAYMACEAALAGTEGIDGGPSKSHLVIKNKWQRVRVFFMNICVYIDLAIDEKGLQHHQIYEGTIWVRMD